MGSQPTCSERIADHLAGREEQFKFQFMRSHPDVDTEDVEAYIEHATDELGFELDEEDKRLIALFKTVDVTGLDAELGDDWDTYEGMSIWDAMETLLERIETDTDNDRVETIDQKVLSVSTTVSIRIDLSTGGPADYVTAEIDTDDRSTSDVVYHFADWFDHAEMPVESGSGLDQLVDYYAEVVQLPGQENDRGY